MFDPTLSSLRVLTVVHDTGSFTAAAERLGFTQSAVSKQVKALEDTAGAALFRRVPRGIEITAAGRVLLTRARTILEEVEAAGRELAGVTELLAARVMLGAFPTAATTLVPRVVAALQAEHPALEVDVEVASSPRQLRRLATGRLDVALISAGAGLPDLDLSGMRTDLLPEAPLLVAVPDSHRLAANARVPVADLAHERWIVGPASSLEPQFGAWPTLVDPVVAFAVQDWSARLGFVAAGLGVTSLPGIVRESVPRGVRLIEVDDPGWQGRRALVVTRAPRSEAVGVVVDAVMGHAARLFAAR